jgi:2-polyprenyl-3-methyl-5-hydroxy-6-metoxy-1,4-benzoquinol methylase
MGAGPRSARVSLLPSSMRRRQVRKRWEKKWKRTNQFPWQAGGVAPELAHAVDAGWLGHGTSILDSGCGSGENAAWLARRGFRVLAIDVAPPAIDEAMSAYRGVPDIAFAVVDVGSSMGPSTGAASTLCQRSCSAAMRQTSRAGSGPVGRCC